MSPHLPMVLQQPNGNSLSMERALKQMRDLLECVETGNSTVLADTLQASLDDLETMLASIDRG